jgi:hypothetical protein
LDPSYMVLRLCGSIRGLYDKMEKG